MRLRSTSAMLVAALALNSSTYAQEMNIQLSRDHNIPLKNWAAPLYWQAAAVDDHNSATTTDASLNPAALTTAALAFVGVAPCRVVDTRVGSFGANFGPPSLQSGNTRTFPIQSGPCSIPAIALAYSFNATIVPVVTPGVTPPGYLGFLTVFPTGQPIPNASTLNNYLGTVVANACIVPAGTNGSVDVFAHDATDLIIDINGYYVQGSAGGGTATTVTVGTTTTGAPGSAANVSNSGTSTAAVLNFTIPQGTQGPPGATGATGSTGPQGATGAIGAQGPPGAAATIGVGNTFTGAPGSQANVVNTGTNSTALFSFTIPQGATGAIGPQGPAGPQGTPGASGPIGPQGSTGVTGPAGPSGTAATITVGSTTTGTPGTPASVINSGTTSAALFNFTIPQGLTGAVGPMGPQGLTGAVGPQGPAGPGGAIGPQGPPGTSPWTSSGSNIYYNGGNVGIGTATPTQKLEVNGNAMVDANLNLGGVVYSGNSGVAVFAAFGDSSQNLLAGYGALKAVTTAGAYNTAVGGSALAATTSGNFDTALGTAALLSNTTGQNDTALGAGAMEFNTTGASNTAIGQFALLYNTTGSYNTVLGTGALLPNTLGSHNIVIGANAGQAHTSGDNDIYIGSDGASESGIIRIGTQPSQTSTFIAGISGVNISGVPVLVSSSGQLGVASSSRRFKQDIEDMGDSTANLMRLRPVTYRYKQLFEDGSQPIQYGLIAEEVEQVYPELVARSAAGKIETVKYQLLDSMLLNEVQKQHTTINAQSAAITEQKEKIRSLEDRLSRLESLLERSTTSAESR